MEVHPKDAAWFVQQLRASDCGSVKVFYLSGGQSAATDAQLIERCEFGLHWTLAKCLPIARLIVCDERTLWECLELTIMNVLAAPVDPWNEQRAVKCILDFVSHVNTEGSDRGAFLLVELQAYASAHIKPKSRSSLCPNTSKVAEDPLATSSAVQVLPMKDGDDYSEGSLVCRHPVAHFCEAIRVPRDEMFFHQTVVKYSSIGRAIQQTPRLHSILENEEALLVLCFVYEMHVLGKDQSHWKALLSRCPTSYPTVPAFWGMDDLYELAGTDVLDDVIEKKGQLHAFCAQVQAALPSIYEVLSPQPPGLTPQAFSAAFTEENILVARSTFDSRAFRLNVDGSVVLSLVPIADMLNHQNCTDILVRRVEPNGGDFVMEVGASLDSADVGRELWMSYGPLQNWELLQHYGFVMPDNVHDKLPFPLTLDMGLEDNWGRRRHSLREKYALCTMQRCWIASHGRPSEALLALLRLELAESEDFAAMEATSPFTPISEATEVAVVNTISQTVKSVLEQFGSSLEEDLEFLEHLHEPPTVVDTDDDEDPHGLVNYELSLKMRIELKRIAHRALAWCDARLLATVGGVTQ